MYKFDLKFINRLLFKYDIGPLERSVVEVLVNCCSSRFATATIFKYGTFSKIVRISFEIGKLLQNYSTFDS